MKPLFYFILRSSVFLISFLVYNAIVSQIIFSQTISSEQLSDRTVFNTIYKGSMDEIEFYKVYCASITSDFYEVKNSECLQNSAGFLAFFIVNSWISKVVLFLSLVDGLVKYNFEIFYVKHGTIDSNTNPQTFEP